MTILDQIIKDKREEIALYKKEVPVEKIKEYQNFFRNTISVKERLLKKLKPGIIAEHKRKSPSKGIINDRARLVDIVSGYQQSGAQAVSILTDYKYFMGSKDDVIEARKILNIPILRKEFIIDEYQVYEAKAIGADFILLIAACLSKSQSEQLAGIAGILGLEVLIEIHSEDELNLVPENVDLVGINNRDLKTFEVDINTSVNLAKSIPDHFVKISESGINNVETINKLWDYGYKGFLIGENFMRTEDPGKSCKEFIAKL